MTFQELLKSFGKNIGFDNLHCDEDGTCCLGVDDAVVSMKAIENERKILLFAKVMDIPREIELRVLRALLKGNYLFMATQKATLSINPDGNSIFLQQIDSFSDLDGELMSKLLEQFVNQIKIWRSLITEAEQSAENNEEGQNRDTATSFDSPAFDDFGNGKLSHMIKL